MRLPTALSNRGVLAALKSGAVRVRGVDLDVVEVDPFPRAFGRMVEDTAFAVCEMPLTTLAMAIDHGRPLIGLPAVVNRDFHHRSIVVHRGSGITGPRDLAGHPVGVRSWSQTTGVWVRGLLAEQYGILADDIGWTTFEDAHVRAYREPDHVRRAPAGLTLLAAVRSGELSAAVIMDPDLDDPDIEPLFPDALAHSAALFATDRIFPANHVVAMDSRLATAHPDLVTDLWKGLVESRERYRQHLAGCVGLTAADRHTLRLGELVDDPIAYGLAANARAVDQVLHYAHDQGLVRRPVQTTELFHPSLLDT